MTTKQETNWEEELSYKIGEIWPLEKDGLFEFLDKLLPIISSTRNEVLLEIEEKLETLDQYGKVNNGIERVELLAKSDVKSLLKSLK